MPSRPTRTTLTPRALAFATCAALTLGAVASGGCGGSAREAVAPRPPAAVAGPLGGEADVVITLHPRAVAADPHVGALVKKAMAETEATSPWSVPWGRWLLGVEAVEIYARRTEGEGVEKARVLLVVRGAPSAPTIAELPLAPKSQGRRRVAVLASGVEEYVETVASEAGGATGSVFVLPGGRTWIAGDAATSAALREPLARRAEAPPAADDGGALLSLSLGKGVLEPLTSTLSRLGSPVPGTVGLARVAFAVREASGLEVALRAEYDRKDQADVLARLAEKKTRDPLVCPRGDAACLAKVEGLDVDASRDGAALTLRVRANRAALDRLMQP